MLILLGLALVMALALLPTATAHAQGSGCPGSLPTRLAIGMRGRVAQSYSSLRVEPGGAVRAVKYKGDEFTVIDGPACGNTLTHYKLDYGDGNVGWASESQVYSVWGDNQYWLEPVPGTGGAGLQEGQGGGGGEEQVVEPVVDNCAGSLAARLVVGQRGVVARTYSTLRSAPNGLGFRIMPNGQVFTVLEGPSCAGGLAWYRLDYGNGVVGWASESQKWSAWGNNLYWLEPLG